MGLVELFLIAIAVIVVVGTAFNTIADVFPYFFKTIVWLIGIAMVFSIILLFIVVLIAALFQRVRVCL